MGTYQGDFTSFPGVRGSLCKFVYGRACGAFHDIAGILRDDLLKRNRIKCLGRIPSKSS
jgi:hypothetical protein